VPLDSLMPAGDLADYYEFAERLGRPAGAWVGLPFAADARVMAYLSSVYTSPPLTWADVTTGTLALPGGESTGLTVLNLYLAQGGTLEAPGGELQLDAEMLAQTLEFLQGLQARGALPLASLDYADVGSTWQVFRERRATLAVTSAQQYLAEYFRVEGAAATLLPAPGDTRLALADAWSWAVVNAHPESQALAADLLSFLMAPAQHGLWTEAAQVLPTRAGSLSAWQSGRMVPFASDVLTHAQLQPPGAMLAVLGPALHQALADVLNGRATPFAAATLAAASVRQP
jgi:ABC-type glycerol-3-phosphate transport system substrate-binding protein